MPVLSTEAIETLLRPYLRDGAALPENLYPQLSLYLDLLVKWNARTNLTAIREPEEMVRRHFGESLFAGQHLGTCATLLDLGSGAGFPGLPIAILRPEIAVTLAESQNKKATFLREAVRTLNLPNVEVWPVRAETLPAARRFHVVTLRAVDNMAAALAAAEPRTIHRIAILTTTMATPELSPIFTVAETLPLPGSQTQHLLLADRSQ